MVRKNTMVTASEVASVLGCSKPTAYKIIQKLNKELADNNKIVYAGKIPRKLWEDKFYGGAEALYEPDPVEEESLDQNKVVEEAACL